MTPAKLFVFIILIVAIASPVWAEDDTSTISIRITEACEVLGGDADPVLKCYDGRVDRKDYIQMCDKNECILVFDME